MVPHKWGTWHRESTWPCFPCLKIRGSKTRNLTNMKILALISLAAAVLAQQLHGSEQETCGPYSSLGKVAGSPGLRQLLLGCMDLLRSITF